jgi:hypothetical protein
MNVNQRRNVLGRLIAKKNGPVRVARPNAPPIAAIVPSVLPGLAAVDGAGRRPAPALLSPGVLAEVARNVRPGVPTRISSLPAALRAKLAPVAGGTQWRFVGKAAEAECMVIDDMILCNM